MRIEVKQSLMSEIEIIKQNLSIKRYVTSKNYKKILFNRIDRDQLSKNIISLSAIYVPQA